MRTVTNLLSSSRGPEGAKILLRHLLAGTHCSHYIVSACISCKSVYKGIIVSVRGDAEES